MGQLKPPIIIIMITFAIMSLFNLKPMGLGSSNEMRASSTIFSTPQDKKPSSFMSQRMISSEPRLTATLNRGNVIRDSFDAIYRSTPLHPLLKAAGAANLPQQPVNQLSVHPSSAETLTRQHPSEFHHNNRVYSSSKSPIDAPANRNNRQDESRSFQKSSHTSPRFSNGPNQHFVGCSPAVQYSPHYFEESPAIGQRLVPSAQKLPPSPAALAPSSSSHFKTAAPISLSHESSSLQAQLPPSSMMQPPTNVPVKRSQRTGGTVFLVLGQSVAEQKRSLPSPLHPSSQGLTVTKQVQSHKKRSDQLSTDHFSQLKNTEFNSKKEENDTSSNREETYEQRHHSKRPAAGKKSKSQHRNIPDADDVQASDEDTSTDNNNKAASKKRKRNSLTSSLPDENQEEPIGKPTRSGRISRPVQRLPGVLDAITNPDTFASPAPLKTVGTGKRKAAAMADKPAAATNKAKLVVNKKIQVSNKDNVWDDDLDIDTNPQPAIVQIRKWEKEETVALYNVHSLSDLKNPNFWLDIAIGMQRLGYNRTEEECNQKWNEGINLMFERKSKKIAKDKMKIEERCLEKLSHNTNTAVMVGKAQAPSSVKEEADNNGQPQAKKRHVLGKNDKKILLQQISKATREDDIFDSNEFKLKRGVAASPLTILAGMDELPTPPVTHGFFPSHHNQPGKQNNNEPLFQRNNVQKIKRIKPQLIASLAPMKQSMGVEKKGKGHALDSTGDIRREIDRAVKKSRVDVLGSSDEEIEEDDEELDDDNDDYDEELAKQRRIYSNHDDKEDGEDDEEENDNGIEHDL